MKNKSLVILLSIFVASFIGCDNSNEEITPNTTQWKGETKDAVITLDLNDDNTCTLMSASSLPGVYAYKEVLMYERWYGVNNLSFYRAQEIEKAQPVYIGTYVNQDELSISQVVDDEEVFLVSLHKVQ